MESFIISSDQQILQDTAGFNRLSWKLKYGRDEASENVVCHALIDGVIVASAIGSGNEDAKKQACRLALQRLKQKCWRVICKVAHDAKQTFSRHYFCSDPFSREYQMKSGNTFSSRMMQKMGWTGGGLGNAGTGKIQPVAYHQNENVTRGHKGLGVDHDDSSLDRCKLKECLEEYASSGVLDDILFAGEFTRQEINFMERHCTRLNNIKLTRMRNQGEAYLIVRRKWSREALLKHVSDAGGETEKFKLLAPGTEGEGWLDSKSIGAVVEGDGGGSYDGPQWNPAKRPHQLESSYGSGVPVEKMKRGMM